MMAKTPSIDDSDEMTTKVITLHELGSNGNAPKGEGKKESKETKEEAAKKKQKELNKKTLESLAESSTFGDSKDSLDHDSQKLDQLEKEIAKEDTSEKEARVEAPPAPAKPV